jgi:hypothetical protein
MKLEGLHWKPKSGTNNLDIRAGKQRDAKRWIVFSEDDVYRLRPIIFPNAQRRKSGCRAASLGNALRTTRSPFETLCSRAQRDHLAQHAQAVAEKTNFASFRVIPAHWNFANSQTGAVREKEQLHVEREAIDPRLFKNG